ncbi:BQ5605_C023g09692 [Microbotryum silenes-dioicae]|uniref:BQ5605_C023g09692 protein n=1 Tax=Microbotryum silenes-dioicae TaxID=796604 RepID=A0A2X0MNY9_9BASI|nr:BQ5605_C023g09692 [Microbotryum silenes-dioicae]
MAGEPPPQDPLSFPQQQQDQLQLPVQPALRSFPSELDIATALQEPPEEAESDPLLSTQLATRRATLEAPAPIMLAPQPVPAPNSAIDAALPPSAPASTTTFADDVAHDSTKFTNGLDSSPLTSHTIHQISRSSGKDPTVDHSVEAIGQGTPVGLEFLLLSGKRMRLSIGDKTSIQRTREILWQRWPPEWSGPEELPPSTQSLRLLYLGKILEDDKTLSTYGIGSSEGANPTVLHVNVRPLSLSKSEKSREFSHRRIELLLVVSDLGKPISVAVAVKKGDRSDGCCGCLVA